MKPNHAAQLDYHILKVLDDLNGPAGTWFINKVIRDKHIRVSPATVGRALYRLEEQGFLQKAGGQRGREVTEAGLLYLSKLERSSKRDEYLSELVHSLQKSSLRTACQHIQVRKLLEPAACSEAAIHATSEDIALMKTAIAQQAQALENNRNATMPSMDFHLLIAKACSNPILGSFIQVLLEERQNNEIIEAIGWLRNTRSADDHNRILEAIERRDPQAARLIMLEHLDRIELLVKQEIDKTDVEEN